MQDRGSKKWTSMMLLEHKERLSAWYKEQDYETKPELDEQQREEINRILMEAIEENYEIEIIHYRNHHFHKVTGHVSKCDPMRHAIQVGMEFNDRLWIDVKDITGVDTCKV